MSRFKVGDKVRLEIEGGLDLVEYGSIGVVTQVWNNKNYYPLAVRFEEAQYVPVLLDEVTLIESAPESDSVNSPNYYVLPNGREVIEFSQWLNGNGAQAVQYIARSTRIDGVVKDNPIEDIKKAILFLEAELKRLESL